MVFIRNFVKVGNFLRYIRKRGLLRALILGDKGKVPQAKMSHLGGIPMLVFGAVYVDTNGFGLISAQKWLLSLIFRLIKFSFVSIKVFKLTRCQVGV